MMALLQRESLSGGGEGARWARMRVHRITSDAMTELGYSSKLNAEWEFLTMLHDEGRRSAEAFYQANRNEIGKRSTLDIDQLIDGI